MPEDPMDRGEYHTVDHRTKPLPHHRSLWNRNALRFRHDLSPSDRPGEVLEKVGQWLGAGVRVVWVLDQVRRDARVYRADGTISTVGPDDELDGEDVLPGFRCPLRDIL